MLSVLSSPAKLLCTARWWRWEVRGGCGAPGIESSTALGWDGSQNCPKDSLSSGRWQARHVTRWVRKWWVRKWLPMSRRVGLRRLGDKSSRAEAEHLSAGQRVSGPPRATETREGAFSSQATRQARDDLARALSGGPPVPGLSIAREGWIGKHRT